ncbi:IS66 family insertion sequence element accessory protein TnpB [Cupriavidus basilensis]
MGSSSIWPRQTLRNWRRLFRCWGGCRVPVRRQPEGYSCIAILWISRVGINGLSILVEQAMLLNPMSSALYVFGNRRRDRIKILGWDRNGFWVLMKRLEVDRFTWPDATDIVKLTVEQLHWLLDGIDIAVIKKHPQRTYVRTS